MSRFRNSPDNWGVIQQSLHWLTAGLIVGQLYLGLRLAAAMPDDPRAGEWIRLHLVVGAAIFAITVIRLMWRQWNPVPRLPDDLTPLQKKIARLNHFVLYGLLLVQPLTGYLMIAGRRGLFPFSAPDGSGVFYVLHAAGVSLLVLFLSLHIVAALRHELVLRDNVLRRMTPLPQRSPLADRRPPPGPGSL